MIVIDLFSFDVKNVFSFSHSSCKNFSDISYLTTIYDFSGASQRVVGGMGMDLDDDDDDDEDDVRLFFLSKMFLFKLSLFTQDNNINISYLAKRNAPTSLPVLTLGKSL